MTKEELSLQLGVSNSLCEELIRENERLKEEVNARDISINGLIKELTAKTSLIKEITAINKGLIDSNKGLIDSNKCLNDSNESLNTRIREIEAIIDTIDIRVDRLSASQVDKHDTKYVLLPETAKLLNKESATGATLVEELEKLATDLDTLNRKYYVLLKTLSVIGRTNKHIPDYETFYRNPRYLDDHEC